MKYHHLFIFLFISVFFFSCKENGMKVKIYYNSSDDLTDIYRTIESIKNGQYKYIGLYSLDEFEISDTDFIKKIEINKQFDSGVNISDFIQEHEKNRQLVDMRITEHGIENLISMTMFQVETLFEIFDCNNEVIFSYLYFENEDYFFNVKNDRIYPMTEEIRTFSKKVIDRVISDNN